MNEKVPLEDIVGSSSIVGAGYNPQKQVFAVRFTSGAIYHYAPVTLDQATDFYAAESKGRYYAAHIKGKVSGQRMTGTCPQCGDEHGWVGDACEDCGTAVYAEVPRKPAESRERTAAGAAPTHDV